jgi:hypothetical protein
VAKPRAKVRISPIAQRPACQLTDDEGMGQHFSAFQEGPKHAVSSAQMIDPDGRVDEGHATRPDAAAGSPSSPAQSPQALPAAGHFRGRSMPRAPCAPALSSSRPPSTAPRGEGGKARC